MNRTQANRSVVAERAATRPIRHKDVPAFRPVQTVHGTGPVRRSTAVRLTSTQRNSEGRRSEWAMTPYVFTDPKWGATCSTA